MNPIEVKNKKLFIGGFPWETPLNSVKYAAAYEKGIIVTDGITAHFYDGKTWVKLN